MDNDDTGSCSGCMGGDNVGHERDCYTKKKVWMEIIPDLLPLERGVPVFRPTHRKDIEPVRGVMKSSSAAFDADRRISNWRLDLASPEGYAYGLRLYFQSTGPSISTTYGWAGRVFRHWEGTTTNQDRVDLAEVLKVSRGIKLSV